MKGILAVLLAVVMLPALPALAATRLHCSPPVFTTTANAQGTTTWKATTCVEWSQVPYTAYRTVQQSYTAYRSVQQTYFAYRSVQQAYTAFNYVQQAYTAYNTVSQPYTAYAHYGVPTILTRTSWYFIWVPGYWYRVPAWYNHAWNQSCIWHPGYTKTVQYSVSYVVTIQETVPYTAQRTVQQPYTAYNWAPVPGSQTTSVVQVGGGPGSNSPYFPVPIGGEFQTAQTLLQTVRQATVMVIGTQVGQFNGFLISPTYAVVDGAMSVVGVPVQVTLANGENVPGKVIATGYLSNFALVKLSAPAVGSRSCSSLRQVRRRGHW